MPRTLRLTLVALVAGLLLVPATAQAKLTVTTAKSLLTKLIDKNDPDRGTIRITKCERENASNSTTIRCRIRYERDNEPLCGKGYVREYDSGKRRFRIYDIESC